MHRVVAEVKPCCKKNVKSVASTLCKCPKKDTLVNVVALTKPAEQPPVELGLVASFVVTFDFAEPKTESGMVVHNHGPPVEIACPPPPSRGPPCLI